MAAAACRPPRRRPDDPSVRLPQAGDGGGDLCRQSSAPDASSPPERKQPERSAAGAALAVLLALGLNSQAPSPTPPGAAVALLCFALSVALLWWDLPSSPVRRLALLALGVWFVTAPLGAAPLAGFALLLWAASRCGRDALRPVATGLLAPLLPLAGVLLLENAGLLWSELSGAAWAASGPLTGFLGQRERLGPVQLGWWLPAFAASLWLAQVSLKPRSLSLQLRLLLLLVVGTVAFAATRQLFLALVTIGLLGYAGDWAAARQPRKWWFTLVAIAPAAAMLAAALYCWGLPVAGAPPRIAGIVAGGLKTFDLPSRTQLREENGAAFGALRLLLPAYGWEARLLPASFSAPDLKGLGVLCVINPTTPLSPHQQQAVEAFVRCGGALLALGDHTDIGGIMGPLNRLLSFTSIRFNFDSAIPQDSPNWRWKSCLRAGLHPALWGRRNDTLGISVGASLRCGPAARVLVVGDRGFSDRGNPRYGVSRLGTMSYQPGERFGGLPLVVEEGVGRGLVQAWGDTSGLQDSALTRSHEMVVSVLEALRSRRPWAVPRAWVVLLCAAVFLASAALLRGRPGLLAAALLGMIAIWSAAGAAICAPAPSVRSGTCVLDASHLPAYPSEDVGTQLGRLNETLLRRRQLLLTSGDFSAGLRRQPVWWTIVAPIVPYRPAEARQLADYVRRGGRLLLLAGGAQREALREVLNQFDLELAPDPYGPAHNSRLVISAWRPAVLGTSRPPRPSLVTSNDPAQSYDAEISFKESYPIVSSSATPLVACWGRPLVVKRPYGQGMVILIGDGRFATLANLGREKPNAPNVRFLLRCLEE